MMLEGQLGQSQLPRPIAGMPAPAVHTNLGLLGNESIQMPAWFADPYVLTATYRTLLSSAQPAFRLALLKRQRFTSEGRERRIALSLAALNAPQPTTLPLAQWKDIVEEIEDED